MTTNSDRNTPFEEGRWYTPEEIWGDFDRVLSEDFERPSQTVYGHLAHPADKKKDRSLRYNNGKPDYSLIPMAAMKEAAHVLEYGASKYAVDNWMKPTNWRVSYACLMRHMSAWQSGEDLDPESGRNHLGHAMCNILQMLYMLENHPEELER